MHLLLSKFIFRLKPVVIFLLFIHSFPVLSVAQSKDTIPDYLFKDTLSLFPGAFDKIPDSVTLHIKEKETSFFSGVPKSRNEKDDLFYLLAGITLLLAILRIFFSRYFATLFRVFFNTSLRQSQLTDQLLQAKLPSLLLNIFFFISGGLYIYFIMEHYQLHLDQNKWLTMGACILLLSIIYSAKFVFLKFAGWLSGRSDITGNYVFVIFLINKIIGIVLVPFLVLLAFSDQSLVKPAIILSFFIAGLLLILRFFKSYGLLQNKLNINRLHFILMITAIEILPFLLIYKLLMLFLNKNL